MSDAEKVRTVDEALLLGEVQAPADHVLLPRRHRAYNFKAIVAQYLESGGSSMEAVVVGVFQLLWQAAKSGDVLACKTLLDRICGKDTESISVAMAHLSDTERCARIEAILAAARGRVASSRITVADN